MAPAIDPLDDPSIPLLTDRIFLKAVELDTALPATLPVPAANERGADRSEDRAEEAGPAQDAQAVEADGPQTVIEAQPAEAGPAEQTAIEAAVEAELDHDLVTASNADFDALLSAEPPTDAGETPEEIDAVTAAVEAQPMPPPADAPAEADDGAADAPPAQAVTSGEAAIEAQSEALRAAVLQRVVQRLPQRVDAAVRDLMQPAIVQAMAKLGEEAEVALRITLQELVEQALREEIEQQASRPRS